MSSFLSNCSTFVRGSTFVRVSGPALTSQGGRSDANAVHLGLCQHFERVPWSASSRSEGGAWRDAFHLDVCSKFSMLLGPVGRMPEVLAFHMVCLVKTQMGESVIG